MDTTTAKYTGQLYFNEEINAAVSNVLPYSTSPLIRTLNSVDQYFTTNQGTQTTLQVTGSVSAGFTATTFVIGIERPEYVYRLLYSSHTYNIFDFRAQSSASSMFSFHLIFWMLGLQVLLIGKHFL